MATSNLIAPTRRVALRAALLRFAPALSLLAVVAVWQILSLFYPPFILPGPLVVVARFIDKLLDGTLPRHALVTLSEALPGLLIGTLLAFAVGYPAAKSALAERLISPVVVASQGVPFVAIAPLIFLWFGSGPGAKILVCAFIVFFPITINIIAGIRGIPPLWRDLFRTHHASRRDTFLKLELPAALPFVFAGLRVGATLSMVGALAGEFLAADRGLGFLINQANGLYDTALVMAGILAIVILALSLNAGVRALEGRLLRAS